MSYQVVKFNNHWSVRDANGDRVSSWYRNKSEAYTAKIDLEQSDAQEELDLDTNLPEKYQVLIEENGRYAKYENGKWTMKKSDKPYKNIEIVLIQNVLDEIPF